MWTVSAGNKATTCTITYSQLTQIVCLSKDSKNKQFNLHKFIICQTFSSETGLDCRQASPVATLFSYEATML